MATKTLSGESAALLRAATCLTGTSYCINCRDALSGARIDLRNFSATPNEYTLQANSHYICHQPVTNYVVTMLWIDPTIQVFDSTKTDGTHNLALIGESSDAGSAIAAPFYKPCYLGGMYWGDVRKYSTADNSLVGLISTGKQKLKGMDLIPDTYFVAFGEDEDSLCLADYDAMVFYTHTLVDVNAARVKYLKGTRLVLGSVIGGGYIDIVAFDKININDCLTFKDSYSLLCASC